ncbi:sodium:calcium antiporter [Streptomyces profundus]|uniref:sodium:calcium antiporter n=1 Tax=Streptomyces profundus TaxID=2867410 RepID=UPI001D16BDF1|nr:cation transporter [Streptomyces sp. MA3_2.13]UED83299.1 cation transporter [Streptomyces sp. MA3_2.13]
MRSVPDFVTGQWPLGWSVALFLAAGLLTVLGSVRLATLGDVLADRTGWGEALFGAVFFGLVTSLSGIVMTAVSAADNHPDLAYSNAVGGIAAQTLAVAAADAVYRRVNLEHAAASLPNLLFGCLLIGLLGLALMGAFSPEVTVLGVHPVSPVMVAFYWGGLRLISDRSRPMWVAVRTSDTVPDLPHAEGATRTRPTRLLWAEFLGIAALVMAGGFVIARAAETFVAVTGLRAGFVGAVLMGVVNALPETVTAIAAVRRGAVTLAIAAVIGGNCLDALNLVVGDVAYRGGSLFHAADADQLFLTAAALVMTTVLLGGLLVRQERGWLRLGFDGVLLIGIYAATVAVLAF